jgi:hypothetical protein
MIKTSKRLNSISTINKANTYDTKSNDKWLSFSGLDLFDNNILKDSSDNIIDKQNKKKQVFNESNIYINDSKDLSDIYLSKHYNVSSTNTLNKFAEDFIPTYNDVSNIKTFKQRENILSKICASFKSFSSENNKKNSDSSLDKGKYYSYYFNYIINKLM